MASGNLNDDAADGRPNVMLSTIMSAPLAADRQAVGPHLGESIFRDLQDERQQVIQALLELDCIPSGMELFYLVIIGGRYGSVDAEGISFTEREYDYAVKRKIPVLAFLHSDPNAIPAGKTELESAARANLDSYQVEHEMQSSKEPGLKPAFFSVRF